MHFGDYAAIRRDYLPDDLVRDAHPVRLLASVHVEAHWQGFEGPPGETMWLTDQWQRSSLPGAIVAFADLTAPNLETVLAAHFRSPLLRGIRMMTRRQVAPRGADLLLDTRFRKGIARLSELGLIFELQAPPAIMAAALDLVGANPGQRFVLSHAGLPLDRSSDGIANWGAGIAAIARFPNVSAKLSGLPMADHRWTPESLAPFVAHLVECFGPERVMFGSNFPVDSLFSGYAELVAGYAACVAGLGNDLLPPIFRDNAMRIYRPRPLDPSKEAIN